MPGVQFVMVNDAGMSGEALGWYWINEPRPHMHPRLAAKVPKCLPWVYVPHVETLIWADASVEFKGEHLQSLVDACASPTGGRRSMSMWRHPWRQNIADEAAVSAEMIKYKDQPVLAQVEHYRGLGMPLEVGMWATGLAVYRGRGPSGWHIVARGWLVEQMRWTYQDQLSLPFVSWRSLTWPEDIPVGWHLDNPWLTFRNHRSEL